MSAPVIVELASEPARVVAVQCSQPITVDLPSQSPRVEVFPVGVPGSDGAPGATGPQGPQGPEGPPVDTTNLILNGGFF